MTRSSLEGPSSPCWPMVRPSLPQKEENRRENESGEGGEGRAKASSDGSGYVLISNREREREGGGEGGEGRAKGREEEEAMVACRARLFSYALGIPLAVYAEASSLKLGWSKPVATFGRPNF
ncbi:hypothetical protein EUGRSUZ_J02656 [Eucalyptus grandis]|uniref:Uncharacterized protein n=2 Tax=Eucalyptus grandis TaxID=71139 RepID=A0ACC3K2Z4_EUCGR|nr:hypothetical protein EUGRSUZ_J02656 [Eucalyptus grandis]